MGYDPDYTASSYQLIVGVQPTNDAGGVASGMIVKYKIGSKSYTIKAPDRFGIVKSVKDCLD
jgi:hypothetical protein